MLRICYPSVCQADALGAYVPRLAFLRPPGTPLALVLPLFTRETKIFPGKLLFRIVLNKGKGDADSVSWIYRAVYVVMQVERGANRESMMDFAVLYNTSK